MRRTWCGKPTVWTLAAFSKAIFKMLLPMSFIGDGSFLAVADAAGLAANAEKLPLAKALSLAEVVLLVEALPIVDKAPCNGISALLVSEVFPARPPASKSMYSSTRGRHPNPRLRMRTPR